MWTRMYACVFKHQSLWMDPRITTYIVWQGNISPGSDQTTLVTSKERKEKYIYIKSLQTIFPKDSTHLRYALVYAYQYGGECFISYPGRPAQSERVKAIPQQNEERHSK